MRHDETERSEVSSLIEKLNFNRITNRDLARLAFLHHNNLPDSIASRMGLGYLHALYRFFSQSPDEFILVARGNERREVNQTYNTTTIVAAAVVSLKPATLTRRMVSDRKCLISLFLNAWKITTLTKAASRPVTKDTSKSEEYQRLKDCPELIIIFSDPIYRSRGIGKELIAACEAELLRRGVTLYTVRTLAKISNRAIAFYENNQFKRVSVVLDKGRDFVFFKKEIFEQTKAPM